jgi:hypothetical protein
MYLGDKNMSTVHVASLGRREAVNTLEIIYGIPHKHLEYA